MDYFALFFAAMAGGICVGIWQIVHAVRAIHEVLKKESE